MSTQTKEGSADPTKCLRCEAVALMIIDEVLLMKACAIMNCSLSGKAFDEYSDPKASGNLRSEYDRYGKTTPKDWPEYKRVMKDAVIRFISVCSAGAKISVVLPEKPCAILYRCLTPIPHVRKSPIDSDGKYTRRKSGALARDSKHSPPISHSSVRPCRHFNTPEGCWARDRCPFAHIKGLSPPTSGIKGFIPPTLGIKGVSPPTAVATEGATAVGLKKPYRTVPCKKFASGHCPYGDKCTFIHQKIVSTNRKTIPCRHFAKGSCWRGDQCGFIHEIVVEKAVDDHDDGEGEDYEPEIAPAGGSGAGAGPDHSGIFEREGYADAKVYYAPVEISGVSIIHLIKPQDTPVLKPVDSDSLLAQFFGASAIPSADAVIIPAPAQQTSTTASYEPAPPPSETTTPVCLAPTESAPSAKAVYLTLMESAPSAKAVYLTPMEFAPSAKAGSPPSSVGKKDEGMHIIDASGKTHLISFDAYCDQLLAD